MRNIFAAVSLATLCIVLLTLGLSAQSDLPDFPDLLDTPRGVQVTIPPFEPPTGTEITVTTTNDDLEDNGNCTLREAIQAANTDTAVDGCPAGDGEDLIVLAAGVYTMSIAGYGEDESATGDFDIRSNLVISGAGAEGTILDANQMDRVFHVHQGVEAEVLSLSIRNGLAGKGADVGCDDGAKSPCDGENGGGIANRGTLIVRDSILEANEAGESGDAADSQSEFVPQGGNGGGIYNEGMLILSGTLLQSNLPGAAGNYSLSGYGGGIGNTGHLVITATQILSNATHMGLFNFFYPYGVDLSGSGGGIWNTGFLTMAHSSVIGNRSSRNSLTFESGGYLESAFGGSGGGILNIGETTLMYSRIENNISGTGGGGGIQNLGYIALLETIVYSNTTGSECGGRHCAVGNGGGIANSGTLVLMKSIISQNQASWGGSGGGLANDAMGKVTVIDSAIISNSSGAAIEGDYTRCWVGKGAGLFNRGQVEILRSIVSENVTASASKHLLWHWCLEDGGSGAGIYNSGILRLTNSTVSRNETGAGTCWKEKCSRSGSGSGIYNTGGLDYYGNILTGTVIIEHGTFAENSVGPFSECDGSVCALPGEGSVWVNNRGRLYSINSLFAATPVSGSIDYTGPAISLGYNFFEYTGEGCPWDANCNGYGMQPTDVVTSYAWLFSLADNGGPTPTHALLPQSHALNAGSCTTFDGTPITEDQRGEPRPQGQGCDIGAYESDLGYVLLEDLFLPVIERHE